MDLFSGKKATQPGDQPSSTDLFSSAKVVADAAQATYNKQTDKVDKTKVADAAEDLLGAAKSYGKLEEKGLGQYVDKAEGYIQQYSSGSTKPTTTASSEKPAATDTKTPASESKGDGDQKSESGYGEAFKMAQGFLK